MEKEFLKDKVFRYTKIDNTKKTQIKNRFE